MCLTVRRNPNDEPDASSSTLFGPGVTQLTIEKPIRPRSSPTAGSSSGRGPEVLYDPAMEARAGSSVVGWKPRVAGVREALTASFATHAYPPHVHDVWTLFLVDEGAVRYGLDRHQRAAEPTMVSVLPPGVVHDGRPATPDGYSKRVVYLEPDVIGEALVGPAVDRPWIADGRLRRDVSRLHDALGCADDGLEAETRLAFVAARIRRSLAGAEPERAVPDHRVADRLRAYLDAHVFEPVTLADAASAVDAGETHAAHSFVAAFGIAPHAYLLGRRLEAARDRILAGQPLADVAAEVGFYDQAHLTRRFRRFLDTTPGRFREESLRR
jgi:AraC-like DNA-binding protein